jgi:hypothetical protein
MKAHIDAMVAGKRRMRTEVSPGDNFTRLNFALFKIRNECRKFSPDHYDSVLFLFRLTISETE